VVQHAVAIHLSDLNPHNFYYGALTYYTIKIFTGLGTTIASYIFNHPLDLTQTYLLARGLAVAFSVATVYAGFAVGNLLAGSTVGLLCAAFLAFSPQSIDLAHYATADPFVGFWSTTAVLGIAMWVRGRKHGIYVAGLATGLAMASKLNTAVLLLVIFLVALQKVAATNHPLNQRATRTLLAAIIINLFLCGVVANQQTRLLGLAATWSTTGTLNPNYVQIFNRILLLDAACTLGALMAFVGALRSWGWASLMVKTVTSKYFCVPVLFAGAAFLVLSPFMFLDLPSFVRDFFFQLNKYTEGGIVGYAEGSRSYQASLLDATTYNPFAYFGGLVAEWGLPAFMVGLWGIVNTWRHARSWSIPLSLLAGVSLLPTLTFHYTAIRYLYPVWVVFALWIAAGTHDLGRRIFQVVQPTWLAWPGVIMLVGLLFYAPAVQSYTLLRDSFLTTDTRNLALEWVQRNVPGGTKILRDWGTPAIESVDPNYQVHYSGFLFEEASLSEWQALGVKLIILSDARHDFYKAHADNFKDVLAEYDNLGHSWKVAEQLKPGPRLKGPVIWIYQAP
jgi:4-amino-4-deoxy-L-arabinose transferase-like glycosyltransferase